MDVILTIASRGSSIFGSGTVSTRTSPVPCQQSAFIDLLELESPGKPIVREPRKSHTVNFAGPRGPRRGGKARF